VSDDALTIREQSLYDMLLDAINSASGVRAAKIEDALKALEDRFLEHVEGESGLREKLNTLLAEMEGGRNKLDRMINLTIVHKNAAEEAVRTTARIEREMIAMNKRLAILSLVAKALSISDDAP